MITRRRFITSTAATASSSLAVPTSADAQARQPLRAEPIVRTLHWKSADDGRLILFSDGTPTPRKLIRQETLESRFGTGTHLVLQQPDHWRMIKEGWFAESDLYKPTDFEDPAFQIWHANYRPETEAHDLLYFLLEDKITGPFSTHIPELGLELSEHPSTPRYATAKLDGDWCLAQAAAEVASRSQWLVIDHGVARGEVRS
jgi:hypothetical protein